MTLLNWIGFNATFLMQNRNVRIKSAGSNLESEVPYCFRFLTDKAPKEKSNMLGHVFDETAGTRTFKLSNQIGS